MSAEAKARVIRRVTKSGALPVSRDVPGYAAVLRVLGVGECWQGDVLAGIDRNLRDAHASAGDEKYDRREKVRAGDWTSSVAMMIRDIYFLFLIRSYS